MTTIKTNEGNNCFENALNPHLDFFSKAGSLFVKAESYYENADTALSLFQKCWTVDREVSFKLLLWLRDCRGGAGNRSGFRECLKWLATLDTSNSNWIVSNLESIPKYGRWDDLRVLLNTSLKKLVAKYWGTEIQIRNVLAAKWADRKDFQIQYALGINEADLRKLIASVRKEHIVEHKMSSKCFSDIEYHTVPSLAMARYGNAFTKHDGERFSEYKQKLANGTETVNASVLFPHDCIRTLRAGQPEIADAQFLALPNYLENTNERIIVIADTSGSMMSAVSGSIRAVDISQGLALYCSEKIGKDNPFYRKFLTFCNESEFKNWNGFKFSEAVCNNDLFDNAIGATRIDTALDLILSAARMFGISNDMMPTALLIVSDMQFSGGGCESSSTQVKESLNSWTKAGFSIPKIVYWNTAGFAGSPDTMYGNNVALVSGFSPSILQSIFNGADLSPIGVMMRTLEKYEVVNPNT